MSDLGLPIVTLTTQPSDTQPRKQASEFNASLATSTQCQLVYENLCFSVMVKEPGKKAETKKDIIKGISGIIQPARLTAVMGASGAGKTSLLNLLAGHVSNQSGVSGSISVNGEDMMGGRMRTISGFVHQEDVILETMTVREALLFAAHLKLPKTMATEDKAKRALDIAHLLNLTKSLDSRVGSAGNKGISGGEKRRLSLGMEMVTNPSIMFLDEPTSGLDSFTAHKVASILATVAHKYQRTIVCTIHQPSSEVFALFDDVIVLAEGSVVYHGPVPRMVAYFDALGYSCPDNWNPTDFLFMQVLHAGIKASDSVLDFTKVGHEEGQGDRGSAAARDESARIKGLLAAWKESEEGKELASVLARRDLITSGVHDDSVKTRAGFITEFSQLAIRASNNVFRNNLILKSKVAQTVCLALVVGLVFLRLGNDAKSVQDRQGSLFFIVVQAFFGSLMGALTVFGMERAIFQREHSSKLYGLSSYFSSRFLVELPSHIFLPILSCLIMYWMIGYQNTSDHFWWFALIIILVDLSGTSLGILIACIFDNIKMALTVQPLVLMPLTVFSGFFINSQSLGWWFRWISFVSPMKYAFIALAKNEFSGLRLECDEAASNASTCGPDGTWAGESVITLLGFDDLGTVGFNAGILFLLANGFLAMAYLALWNVVRRQHQ
ncbi:ABC-2 type transporter-domain-containing protein [Haematococcus lacustris]